MIGYIDATSRIEINPKDIIRAFRFEECVPVGATLDAPPGYKWVVEVYISQSVVQVAYITDDDYKEYRKYKEEQMGYKQPQISKQQERISAINSRRDQLKAELTERIVSNREETDANVRALTDNQTRVITAVDRLTDVQTRMNDQIAENNATITADHLKISNVQLDLGQVRKSTDDNAGAIGILQVAATVEGVAIIVLGALMALG